METGGTGTATTEEAPGLESENLRLKTENLELKQENDGLKEENARLVLAIAALQERLKVLEHRQRKNSENSSKPPSSDGYRKPAPKNLREKSGRKPGGQRGHPGHHMEVPHEPDAVVTHFPGRCVGCPNLASCTAGQRFECGESRYVVDVVVETKVTEHRSMRAKGCPLDKDNAREPASAISAGAFPVGVSAHVQYGDSVAVVSAALNTYGAMSCSRISGLMRSLCGITISAGTVSYMTSRASEKTVPALAQIRERLVESAVCHFDETGSRVGGKTRWVQNASNSGYTYQTLGPSRGCGGIDFNGVLPRFKGISVHDCWTPYWKYGVRHGICCVHILRELKGIEDLEPDHVWPRLFRIFLLSMKAEKEEAIDGGGTCMPVEKLEGYSERYDRIMRLADDECPMPVERHKPGGREKLGEERSLIERLILRKDSVYRFVREFEVPFSNNLAERDIRNVKVKTKVSGCFRTEEGAQRYLNIMSYLSTAGKHGVDAFTALKEAFNGNSTVVL